MMMGRLGYGVIKMAYSFTRSFFGVCGNFRFKIYSVTDAASTSSVIEPKMNVRFVASANTSDNADHMRARVLNWSSTADTDVLNEIKDTTVTFVAGLTGSQAHNTTDNLTSFVSYKDGDELYAFRTGKRIETDTADTATYDVCPDGNEAYAIIDDHKIMVTPVTGNDDGTLFVLGE
jgi:hypothetical protein